MTEKVTCTMVFEIDRSLFKSMNPLNTETPWGVPYAVSVGDALEEGDKLREEAEHWKDLVSSADLALNPFPPLKTADRGNQE